MEHTTHGNTLELSCAVDVRCTAEFCVALYKGLIGKVRGGRTGSPSATAGGAAPAAPRPMRLLHLSHLRWMIPVAPSEQSSVS